MKIPKSNKLFVAIGLLYRRISKLYKNRYCCFHSQQISYHLGRYCKRKSIFSYILYKLLNLYYKISLQSFLLIYSPDLMSYPVINQLFFCLSLLIVIILPIDLDPVEACFLTLNQCHRKA